jgi:uncharacterized protein
MSGKSALNARKTVVVLGASNKPERYSNKALKLLQEHGYRVIPVHPILKEIEGLPVINHLCDIKDPVHTLTVYIGPAHIIGLIDDIIALKPERVILNPGAESMELMQKLSDNKINYLKACTLVLLHTNQF